MHGKVWYHPEHCKKGSGHNEEKIWGKSNHHRNQMFYELNSSAKITRCQWSSARIQKEIVCVNNICNVNKKESYAAIDAFTVISVSFKIIIIVD